MPQTIRRLARAGLLVLACLGPSATAAPADPRPNVVIVLMDDVGFGDLGAYGSEIETPQIDRLAENGLRYTHFTVTGVCSPTRAALLTGLNHHSAGVGFASDLRGEGPGYRGFIHRNVATLPEILRAHGYATLMVGKWHLVNASERGTTSLKDNWPTGRGFDRFWGFLASHTSQWMPHELWDGTDPVEVPSDGSFYLPDALTDRAIAMLEEERASGGRPFFLYYATGANHSPHHTKPADRAKYRGRYAAGYDAVRAQRLARQIELELFPEGTPLAPAYPGVEPWSRLSEEEQLVSMRLQENYAAFLDNLDQNVGRLVAYLERVGALEDTLLIVTSDNGASREAFAQGTTNQGRYFARVGETHEQRMRELEDVGGPDSYPNYPHGWMQVSNSPFKLRKASVHAGGVRVPFIVHWPAGFTARGELRRQFHHVNDVVPTLLELLGIGHPAADPATGFKPVEGVSMAYSFAGAETPSHKREQYYEMEGNRAYFHRGWKLVSWHPDGEPYEDYGWELYDLREDPTESRDLAAQMPEKVAELEQRFTEAAERHDVLPIDDRFMTDRAERLPPEPQRLVFGPGAGPILPPAAPNLVFRDFSITADVVRGPGDDGVLAAMGDIHSGLALYVLDGFLNFEVNQLGEFTRVRSERELPMGDLEIRADFDKDGSLAAMMRGGLGDRTRFLGGRVTLHVNGERVGRGRLPQGPPLLMWEGLDVGLDRRSPVTHAYPPPFAFSGALHRVVFELR